MIYKNALVSVSNKEGIVDCVRLLVQSGTRVVSTGGTAQLLLENGLAITPVTKQTSFPEVMDGRVKTLHPHIFLPLLARLGNDQDEQELKSRDLKHFDLVICNLYPFDQVLKEVEQEQVELIDVGGPSILRASAKNFEKIAVICDPKDYTLLQTHSSLSLEIRRNLAAKVFFHLSSYDSTIAHYLDHEKDAKSSFSMSGSFFKKLRYGENPQQKSSWYRLPSQSGLHSAQVLQGKEVSFNNVLDIQSAVSVLREFHTPCFIGVKHNNPCGVACGSSLTEAVQKGLHSDPLSIFGGIVAVNQKVEQSTAQQLSSIFLECLIAPDYSEESLEVLSKKKNLRILKWKDLLHSPQKSSYCIYKVDGGFLVQDQDQVNVRWDSFKIDGKKPDENIKKDLEMAWKVCAHLKSNAISLVSQQQTVGLGMGQVDRVTAVDLACQRMRKHHPNIQSPVVMASDGFFPFEDSIRKAAQEGIYWIIQPGGSVKDSSVIQTGLSLGVNTICTGCRHFRH